jgi:flagellar assembly factor FliW
MPRLKSRYFGELEYSPETVFEFPLGIPAFEGRKSFVCVEQPQNQPLVFIQSLDDPNLCFIGVPVFVADPKYQLRLAPEDLLSINLPTDRSPRIGDDVLCLALVTVTEGADPTVNLASPIVLNLLSRQGIQAIQLDLDYSYRHPLLPRGGLVQCS